VKISAKQPQPVSRKGASDPPINCAHDALLAPEALQLNARNPNRHSAEQLRIYAKIIRHQGWRKPIVVSKRSGLVVAGAGATLCARQEKWRQVPVDYQEFKSEADEYAHLVADNMLPQMADMDDELVAAIVAKDLEGKLDLELAGLAAKGESEEGQRPEYEITAKLNECYDYVLIFTENATDFAHLQELCGVKIERCYKKHSEIGIGRCVPFKRFLNALAKLNWKEACDARNA
jgi:hypothetical protein